MATQYKLFMTSYSLNEGAVVLDVGVFAATVDPTAKDATGKPVNTPLATLNVGGTAADTAQTWSARATEAFSEWCRQNVIAMAAQAQLAANAALVLTVSDPTGN